MISILSGCANNAALQKNVELNNQQVSMVLSSYNKSNIQADDVTPTIITAITSGNTQPISHLGTLSSSVNVIKDVQSYVVSIHSSISAYVSQHNSMLRTSGSSLTISKSLVSSSVKVHYFLNSNNGELDQMFLVELPNGFVGYMSIIWLGGDVVSVKAHNLG